MDESPEATRICSKCHLVKPHTEFYVTPAGRRESRCDLCRSNYQREYAKRNAAKLKAQHAVYYAQHQEELKQRSAANRRTADPAASKAYRDKHYANNKERYAIWRRNWLVNNKEAHYASQVKRRAKAANSPNIEKVLRSVVFERDSGICYLCERPVTFKEMQADHVVPISREGEHNYANCKTTHKTCNQRKADKLLSELNLSTFRVTCPPAPQLQEAL